MQLTAASNNLWSWVILVGRLDPRCISNVYHVYNAAWNGCIGQYEVLGRVPKISLWWNHFQTLHFLRFAFTLQGTRKHQNSKNALGGDMLVPRRVINKALKGERSILIPRKQKHVFCSFGNSQIKWTHPSIFNGFLPKKSWTSEHKKLEEMWTCITIGLTKTHQAYWGVLFHRIQSWQKSRFTFGIPGCRKKCHPGGASWAGRQPRKFTHKSRTHLSTNPIKDTRHTELVVEPRYSSGFIFFKESAVKMPKQTCSKPPSSRVFSLGPGDLPT